jgi:hypothetical protein
LCVFHDVIVCSASVYRKKRDFLAAFEDLRAALSLAIRQLTTALDKTDTKQSSSPSSPSSATPVVPGETAAAYVRMQHVARCCFVDATLPG